MKMLLKHLRLNCKKSIETVPFAGRMSFFHGEMSTGKSSIPALVDYALGSRFPKTPALDSELLSVQLRAQFGSNDVVIERSRDASGPISVTWEDDKGEKRQCLAPLRQSTNSAPILGEDVFTLSDLLLNFMGVDVLRVRKRTYDPESQLVRLSFRDVLEFVYLNQDDLDSDFFLLDVPIRKEKSQDTLRYFMGMISEKLNDLQTQLQEVRQAQRTKRETVSQIEAFLTQFEFESEERINQEISKLSTEEDLLEKSLETLRAGYQPAASLNEEDQKGLLSLDQKIHNLDTALSDVHSRVREQEGLQAELIGLKLRAARTTAAHTVLDAVTFEICPACASAVSVNGTTADACYLCKTPLNPQGEMPPIAADIFRQDIDSRIEELKESIRRHKRELAPMANRLDKLRDERRAIDTRLRQASKSYETDFLARSRAYDKRLAAINERIKNLKRVKAMPARIKQIQGEADLLTAQIERLRREIEAEENNLVSAEHNYKALEKNYKQILLDIGFPDISQNDTVEINRRTLIPEVIQSGQNAGKSWTYFDIGSGGKKTLLKICFALALHLTAAEKNLPVPSLLMIDSPMKNITPDVNPIIFRNFYAFLYNLLKNQLADWQVVLVDQTYSVVPSDLKPSIERQLTRNDPSHPRLISYYKGS
jgi:hypothetical protein